VQRLGLPVGMKGLSQEGYAGIGQPHFVVTTGLYNALQQARCQQLHFYTIQTGPADGAVDVTHPPGMGSAQCDAVDGNSAFGHGMSQIGMFIVSRLASAVAPSPGP